MHEMIVSAEPKNPYLVSLTNSLPINGFFCVGIIYSSEWTMLKFRKKGLRCSTGFERTFSRA
ncbi:hypothetical protein CVN76_20840 [Bacillus sp. mrc49]|nr:hypothetical protein CVN76_20840 [Bacillus sp. mrc49]